MSDLEYFFLGGKSSELQRHVSCRIYLLNHLKTDAAYLAVIYKLAPRAQLVQLHAEATSEVAVATAAGHPIAYDGAQCGAPTGGALERYFDAWHDPAREILITHIMKMFVSEGLNLKWAWLPHELERLLYFLMLDRMGIHVDIEHELWLSGTGQKRTGPGRYQRPNSETVKRHVEWFYRHRIVGEKMVAIAAEVNKEETTVRDAIHGVERVLRVSPTLL